MRQLLPEDTAGGALGLNDPHVAETLRKQMLSFAILQLRDTHLAEDAVQEALLGALRNAGSFAGRAAFKTWVFAILRNKIADILRQRRPGASVTEFREDPEDQEPSGLFDAAGHWHPDRRPTAWREPDEALEDDHFWRIFDACLTRLPARHARVFMMREFSELDSQEICAALAISTSNLNVMLHRARLKLRECLEHNWFAPGGGRC